MQQRISAHGGLVCGFRNVDARLAGFISKGAVLFSILIHTGRDGQENKKFPKRTREFQQYIFREGPQVMLAWLELKRTA